MKLAALSTILLAATPTASLGQGRPTDVPRQIYGKVQVINGATFEFIKSRQVVRLAGYEAPLLEQMATSERNLVSCPLRRSTASGRKSNRRFKGGR